MKANDIIKKGVSAKASSPPSSLSHARSSRDASTAWVQAVLYMLILPVLEISATVLMADAK